MQPHYQIFDLRTGLLVSTLNDEDVGQAGDLYIRDVCFIDSGWVRKSPTWLGVVRRLMVHGDNKGIGVHTKRPAPWEVA